MLNDAGADLEQLPAEEEVHDCFYPKHLEPIP